MTETVDRARTVADQVLAPSAEATDRAAAVPAGHLAALAEAGLFGLYGPASHSGLGSYPADARAVHRVLGGACGATYFVWAQH